MKKFLFEKDQSNVQLIAYGFAILMIHDGLFWAGVVTIITGGILQTIFEPENTKSTS